VPGLVLLLLVLAFKPPVCSAKRLSESLERIPQALAASPQGDTCGPGTTGAALSSGWQVSTHIRAPQPSLKTKKKVQEDESQDFDRRCDPGPAGCVPADVG
jgi:hypothetical protein